MGRPPFPTATPNPPMPQATPPRPPGAPAIRPTLPSQREVTAERRTLVVGRGISVQGMVQDAERLVVEGLVEATMIHATELVVQPGGVFKGEVEVEDSEVSGTVDGTVTARGSLVVRATGTVLGTARCRRLQVEDGGRITGQIEMLSDPARSTENAA
jgi:cytoskeletal protein CcmA (bactofilin family)